VCAEREPRRWWRARERWRWRFHASINLSFQLKIFNGVRVGVGSVVADVVRWYDP